MHTGNMSKIHTIKIITHDDKYSCVWCVMFKNKICLKHIYTHSWM